MSPSLEVLVGATQGLTLILVIGFLTYLDFVVVPYLRHRPAPAGDPRLFGWHVLVPCRDEEAVVGETVAYVRRTFPLAHVWVIDDASTDETATVVAGLAARDGGVHLVRRSLPDARTGKADALNAGYRELVAWLASYDALGEAERTIVCVVDAGDRPAPGAPAVCAGPGLFGDPSIGGVQVDVRMSGSVRLRGRPATLLGRTLIRLQDLESRTATAAVQLSRRTPGTVSMGGSGQFTRLSALAGIDVDGSGRPWRGSPVADLELGVQLLAAGYRTGFTVDTHVDRRGVPSLRRLLAQRTRWRQATLRRPRHLRRVWTSGHRTTPGAAELLPYLFRPWLQLAGTLVYPLPWLLLAHRAATEPDTVRAYFSAAPGWILFGLYGASGLLPFVIWGPVYRRRCEPGAGPLRALGWGTAYALYAATIAVSCWWAALRVVRWRPGRAGARRNAEALRGRVLATER